VGVCTEITGLIGDDQTELNRLMTSQYRDGDTSCRVPDCLLPRKTIVPAHEVYVPGPDGAHPCTPPGVEPTAACRWEAVPSALDPHTGLALVDVDAAARSLQQFRRAQAELGRVVPALERRVSHWMWGGRIRVGLLPMGQFLQGHTYFVQHLHEQLRTAPVHVHVTYTLAGDYGKRFRLRSAGLWQAEADEYYTGGDFVHVVGIKEVVLKLLQAQSFAPGVWESKPGEAPSTFFDNVPSEQLGFAGVGAGRGGVEARVPGGKLCYHPSRMVPPSLPPGLELEHTPDPATPHVRLQHVTRFLLRNALALASAMGRRLVLPTVWCMCDRYWWHLRDCRMPGAEGLTMPFECPLDMSFNVDDWQRLQTGESDGRSRSRYSFIEHSFLANPRTDRAIKAEAAASTLRLARDDGAGGDDTLPDHDGHVDSDGVSASWSAPVVSVRSGSTVEDVVEAVRSSAGASASRVLRVTASSLLRLTPCGFRDARARSEFEADVLQIAFGGQHSYCGSERNPNVALVLERARRTGMPDERALILYRNCTGNPANEFNKPKVDLGPTALRFVGACAPVAVAAAGRARTTRSAAARIFDTVLSPSRGGTEGRASLGVLRTMSD
jgi:hypothetical protein